MSEFIEYATFFTTDKHRQYFKKGHLVEDWSQMYPFLFDAHDSQIALNQRHLGYHYHEWLAAVLLYHTRGLFSLIEAYAYQSHQRKRKILETLVTGATLDFIARSGISSSPQCPDLLVYKPDMSDWFFCEVKGPKDKFRDSQINFFHDLERVSGKSINVVKFINIKV